MIPDRYDSKKETVLNATAPCKNCEKRHIGCHADCEKYLAYRQLADAQRKDRARTYDDFYVSANMRKRINANLREGKQHKVGGTF